MLIFLFFEKYGQAIWMKARRPADAPVTGLGQHKSPSNDGLKYLVGEDGFEPSKSVTTDLQSAPFGRSGTLPKNMELVDGFEPPTC